MNLLLASQNKHKAVEIEQYLGMHHTVKSLSELGFVDELPETHATFRENASEKARFVFQRFGVPCFAEDSGLEVTALHGEPGVYSARYAGPGKNDADNMVKLLHNLEGIENREATFRTVIALVMKEEEHFFEGAVQGKIALAPSGSHGFGYDPVFIPEGYSETFAVLGQAVKHKISHRAKALAQLLQFLERRP